MCHHPASTPPAPGEALCDVAEAGPLTLTARDGAAFAAHLALPDLARADYGTGVVVLPDNRGLSGFYQDLCGRLAGLGHPAVAIDYFGRTAGAGLAGRGPDFPHMEHMFQTEREQLFADIHAALAVLREHGAPRLAALGFCFGGRLAFLTADAAFGLAAVAGFYGFPGELFGAPGPTQLAGSFTAPVLGLFGGADAGIPAGAVAEFGAALAAAEVRHELVVYPGMPHSFFDIAPETASGPAPGTAPDTAPAATAGTAPDTPSRRASPDTTHPASDDHRESDLATVCADAWSRVRVWIKEPGGEPWRAGTP